MWLRRLRAFSSLIEEGSVASAAQSLNLSQSAVSRILSGLEAELDIPLFERKGRTLSVTEDGMRFHAEIRGVLEAIDALPDKAATMRKRVRERLRLISMPSLVRGIALPLIADMKGRHPSLNVDLEVLTGSDFDRTIDAQAFDIALAVLPVESSLVTLKILPPLDLGIVTRVDSPLAQQDRIDHADLAGQDVVTLPPGTRYRAALDDLLTGLAERARLVATVPTLDMAISLVQKNGAATLAEQRAFHDGRRSDLVWRPLMPSPRVSYGILRPRTSSSTAIEVEMLEVVEACAARFIAKTA